MIKKLTFSIFYFCIGMSADPSFLLNMPLIESLYFELVIIVNQSHDLRT